MLLQRNLFMVKKPNTYLPSGVDQDDINKKPKGSTTGCQVKIWILYLYFFTFIFTGILISAWVGLGVFPMWRLH